MGFLIAPLVAAVGIPGLTAVGGGLTILGKIVVAGLGIALSIGAELLLGSAQKRPKPQDVKTVVRSSVAPRVRLYGRGRLGGNLAFIHSHEGDLYQVLMFCEGFDEVEGFVVDDRTVNLNGGGWVTTDPYNGDSVRILVRLGRPNQNAVNQLVSALPSIWTSDHRLRGIAYAVVIAQAVDQDRFSKVYPNKWPVLNVIARGSAGILDPRNGSSGWSQNVALMLRDYLVHPDGARIPASLVDDDLFAAAAEVCDETVPIKGGGTIKRYHGALVYKFDEEPRDVIERFITAMDARTFLTPEGRIGIHAGKWIVPTVTLTDDHILDYDLEDGAGPHRRANEVRVKYTQVEANYSEATADPWRDDAAIATDGIIRPLSPEIYEVQHHNHARRLAKILMARANPHWAGTITTTLFGLECFDQRWIRVEIEDLGIEATFEITGFRLDTVRMSIILEVQSFAADAYAFDPDTEEGTAPALPAGSGGGGTIPAPASVAATAVPVALSGVTVADTNTVYDSGSGSNETTVTNTSYPVGGYAMRVTVAAPPKASLRVRVEYEVDGSGEWDAVPVNQTTHRATTPALSRGATYRARARYKSPGGASAWVTSAPVTIP